MQHRQDDQRFVRFAEIRGIWECVKECPTNVLRDDRKLKGPGSNALEHAIDIGEKPSAEAGTFVLVPAGGLFEICFGQRTNNELPGHAV